MPLHDWSRVPAGLFHDFHQTWSIQIKLALNAGILPSSRSRLQDCSWLISSQPIAWVDYGWSPTGRLPAMC